MRAAAALSSPLLLVLLLAAVHHCCVAVSLMQRIRESDNLTVFSQLLADTGLDRQLDVNASCAGAPCFLVFAPTDEAFARSAGDVAELLGGVDSRLQLANQHIVVIAIQNGKKVLLSSWPDLERPPRIGRDVGLGQARLFSAGSSVLFWQAKLAQDNSWSYHANNARINAALSNQEAANGVYHVLDDVALPLGRDLSLLALINSAAEDALVRRLSIGRTLRIFKDWMARDIAFQFLYNALLGASSGGGFSVRTVFLPTDAAWEALPTAAWQRLNASAEAFRDVLTAHVAANVSLFTGWLPAPPPDNSASDSTVVGVDFVAGHAESKSQLAGRLLRLPRPRASRRSAATAAAAAFAVVVGGVVSSVGEANLPLRDAVVHTVDRVLAFPGHRGLADAAETLAPGFRDLCRRFAACELQLTSSSGACTLLAPVDVAGLLRASESASAADAVEQILLLHFVPNASIASINMTNGLLVSGGARTSGQIRFRWSQDSSKLWVEGRLPGSGFVQSELLTLDEATESGCLLHTIATPLAAALIPAAVRLPSLGQLIGRQPRLSAAAVHLDAGDFRPALGGGGGGVGDFNGTAFVPDNAVMAQLESFVQEQLVQLAAASVNASSSSSNASLSAASANDLLAEALRSLLIPGESFVAGDAPTGKSFTYRTAANFGDGSGSATVSLTVVDAGRDGSADRIVRLQSDSMVAQARVSSGQYQCTNGILYTLESAAFHQRRSGGDGRKAEMMVGNGAAVAMATATTTALVLAASAPALLQLLVHS